MTTLYIVLFLFGLVSVNAEYECLCNFHSTGINVYSQPNNNSKVIGILQQFGCKPTFTACSYKGHWKSIQFQRQIGLILVDSYIEVRKCAGTPPNRDIFITTTSQPTFTTTATSASTTTSSTITPQPAFTSTPLTTTKPATMSTITTTPCSTTTLTTTTTTDPTTISTTTATPKPTTRSSTISTPKSTTTSITTTRPITITVHSTTPVPHGDISKCPDYVRLDAVRSGGYLDQYGQYCFVINPHADTWSNAENHCKVRNGHLLTIQNAQEQEFFTNYLKSHNYREPVYIGLNDEKVEGTYLWSSGAPITYTNWVSNYNDKYHHHASDDCVVMKPDGKWDDVNCGVGLIVGIGAGGKHHFICQYGLNAKAPDLLSLIGGLIG